MRIISGMKVAFFDTKEYDRQFFWQYSNGGPEIIYYDTGLNAETAGLARGADAVCVFVNDDVNAAVINKLAEYGVKLIALRCAGYNNVDIKAAYGKIPVVRVPAYSPYAVAEHAMAMLLCSVRRIHKAYNRTRDFNFSLNGLTGFVLHGKTVGVIGTGKIGSAFIDICRGFGMEILAYDKQPALNNVNYAELGQLMRESDIISLHCPLTPETKHMIDENSIRLMKKGVVIINTSRGELIDSEALLWGIKERKIGAACLDVYEEESDLFFEDFSGHILNDDILARLISMPNVLVTSHQAFLTEEALSAIAEVTVDNIRSFFERGELKNEVLPRGAAQGAGAPAFNGGAGYIKTDFAGAPQGVRPQ